MSRKVLGLKIHENAIGWALLESRHRSRTIRKGERSINGSQADEVMTLLAAQEASSVSLKVYENDAAYAYSRAAFEGLSRAEHREMVEQLATELRGRKVDVEIESVS